MADFSELDLGIGLDDMIRLVQSVHPDGNPIDRVGTAMMVGERLGELGDHLIGHFVDQARASGASWQSIGAGLGVSKQAAQKRFVPGAGDIPEGGLLSRFAPRARAAVVTARDEARQRRSPEVTVEHVLLGLVADPDALAARALDAQHVTGAQIRERIDAADLPTADELPEHIRYSARAKKVLELAVREALRLGHNYIGTEHMLLAIFRDGQSLAARILAELGASKQQTADWLQRELAELVARKTS